MRAALAIAGLTLASAHARADAMSDRCVDANTNGQALRLDGKLGDARVQLEACTDPRCPAIVRDDCASRLRELDAVEPTMILALDAPPGGPVTVSIDGKPVAHALEGPFRVDPGTHLFLFTRDGQEAVSRTFVVREGEKNRREKIVLPPPPARLPAPGPVAAAPEQASAGSPRKTAGLVVGAVGLTTLAVGAVFGLLTSAASRRQQDACASPTSCSDRAQALSEHDTAQTDGAISTVGFVAGGALLVGGALLYLTAPSVAEPAAPRVSLAPAVGPREGGMSLRLVF
jgi:hypothetical protein